MLGRWIFASSVRYRFGVRPTHNPIFSFEAKILLFFELCK